MKENLTNKEIEIKNAIEDISFDLNTDDLWSNIEPQLPPENDSKRRPFWWKTAGAIASITLASVLIISFYNLSDHPIAHPVETEIQTSYIDINATNDPTPKKGNLNKATNNNQKLNNPATKANTITHSTLPQSLPSHGQNLGLMDDSYNNNSGNLITRLAIVHQLIPTEDLYVISSHKTSYPPDTKLLSTSTIQNRDLVNRISTLQPLKLQLLENYKSEDLNLLSFIEPIQLQKWQPYWKLSTGINKSLSKTTFQNNIEIEKGSHEQNLIGLSNSLEYGKENLKGWRLFTGLSHHRLSTRYRNFDRITLTNTEIGEVSKTIDGQGNEFINLGDIEITTIIENKIIWHRAHDYLNLNIGTGKRMILSNRLSLIADVNASYNIWSHHKGYYFDQSTPTIIKFVASEENPYQNQGLGIGGKLSMEYDMGSFALGLSTLYETSINNTISTNYFHIKNSHYGVQLGVVYRP